MSQISSLLNSLSCEEHDVFLQAVQFVHSQYLSQPYEQPQPPFRYHQQLVFRPNYGLSHMLRKCMYLPVVLNLLQKTSIGSTLQLTSKDLLRIFVTFVFAETGRRNGAMVNQDPKEFIRFRQKSAQLFKQYIDEQLTWLFNPKQIDLYSNILLSFEDPLNKDPKCILMRLCQKADQLRMTSWAIGHIKLKPDFLKWMSPGNYETFLKYIHQCLIATGTDLEQKRTPEVFITCNLEPSACLERLYHVPLPVFEHIPQPLNSKADPRSFINPMVSHEFIQKDILKTLKQKKQFLKKEAQEADRIFNGEICINISASLGCPKSNF